MDPARLTKRESLKILKRLGFNPSVVFDVGVQNGTPELYETYPESTHILIEAVKENEPAIKQLCRSIKKATYFIAAAGKRSGKGTLKVTRNCMYAGLVEDSTPTDSNSHFHREVSTIALDDLVKNAQLQGPFLLKIDVDGNEPEILEGAKETLKQTAVAVIESTLFFQIHEVIDAMSKAGFVIYDIVEPLHRPLDGALWQVDIFFVPKNSPFRNSNEYAAPEHMKVLRGG